MNIHTGIVRIRSDDYLFTLTMATLDKYPDSLFYKIMNNDDKVDFIFKENNTLYVDMRPENLKCIIDYMRGYEPTTSYSIAEKSVQNDFVRLGIKQNLKNTDIIDELNTDDNLNDDSVHDVINNSENKPNSNNSNDSLNVFPFNVTSESQINPSLLFQNLRDIKNNYDTVTSLSELNNDSTFVSLNLDNKKVIRPRKIHINTQNDTFNQ